MNPRQLKLIDGELRDWKLEPAVRERGFQGIAAAREALAASQPSFGDPIVHEPLRHELTACSEPLERRLLFELSEEAAIFRSLAGMS
ncbi:MAG: hypothetical protein P8N50_07455 [Actinomycetota bacterium]|nr:hypothetical protein [Actinomycetota bacterium]